jgi:predicted ester cyclase
MSIEERKALARRWFTEGWGGNLALADQIFAPDFMSGGKQTGPTAPKQTAADVRVGFADIHVTIDRQIAEGDWVVTHYTARGTHQGEFNRIPATGKSVEASGVVLWRFGGDKVVEGWTVFDQVGLLRQLGVLPQPQA